MKTLSRFSLILTLLVSSLCITPNAWADFDPLNYYMKITAVDGGMTVTATKTGSFTSTLKYSKNGTDWYNMASGNGVYLASGDFIYVRDGEDEKSQLSTGASTYWKISAARSTSDIGFIDISGNIMSLVCASPSQPSDTLEIPETYTYCFNQLFTGSSYIRHLKDLRMPATTLTDYCYQKMCYSISNLLSTPKELPALSVPKNAYDYMFYQCVKLTEVMQNLPATTIGAYAYECMFKNCSTALVTAPNIKARTLGSGALYQMFYGCSALQFGPDTLYSEVIPFKACSAMFYNCSALKQAPIIMARTPRSSLGAGTASSSGSNGYNCSDMFHACSNLDTMTCYFEEWCTINNQTYGETYKWVDGVKSTGVFYMPAAPLYALSSKPSRGHITYVPQNGTSNRWVVRAFFDYTYNPNGGTWDGISDATNKVRRNYIECPKTQSGYYNDRDSVIHADVLKSFAKGDECTFKTYKTGYKFYGWNTDPEATKETTSGWANLDLTKPLVTQNSGPAHQTYYAIYELAASDVKLTFNPNGGTWTDGSSTDSKVFDSPLASVPAITKTGYHLLGWQDNDGKDFEPRKPYGEDITFTAIWLPIYTFIPTGGTWEDTETSDTRTFYGDFDLPTLTKIGCYNLTWSPALPVAPATWPDIPTTYTASWSEYQFTFHAQAGTWTEGGGSDDKIYGAAVGNRPTTLPAITRDGYLFRGWNTAGDASGDWLADAAGLPDFANGKYYAIWSEIFTFYPNNGTWTNGSQDASRVLYKYNITADDIAISRSQYVFDGWNPAFDIDNMPSASGSFTAQWLPELTFNPNGGKWSDESTTAKVITTAVGETPTRNGYAFTGWDNSYNPASLPITPTTFTAQWNAYTYTFNVATNGGTWDGSDDANKDFTEETLASLTNPQRPNHVFLGWNTASDGSGNNFNIDHLPTANTTFYAQFSEVHFFSIKALTDNVTIGTKLVNSPSNLPTLSYSTDDGATWTELTLGASGTKIVLAQTGDSVLFRGTNERLNPNSSHISGSSLSASPVGDYWTFTATDQVSVTGNLMTLIQDVHPTNTLPTGDFCVFGPLFAGMPVVDASCLELPTVTSYSCYQYMFYSCTSLTQAPVLPATYAERSAYCGMFSGCSSLTTAPTIYATDNGTTTTTNGAFAYMFYNCSTLSNMSVKFATWKTNATNTWVRYVASSGTFTCPSALPQTMGSSNIPSNWTVQFIPELTFNLNGAGHWDDLSTDNLIVEPEIPLTTLPVAIADAANRVFYGWNTSANGSGTWLTLENQPVISTTAQRITYYAIYAPNPAVNITFSLSNYPDASWDGSDKTDKVISTADLLTSGRPVPQLGDQYFGGWITSPTGTTNELDLANLPTEATTYYPIFHNYLCFTALADGARIGSHHYNGTINVRLSYCQPIADGGDGQWHTFLPSTDAQVILNEGQKVYVRGYNPQGINSANGADFSTNKFWKFNISNRAVSISGNIMTLIDSLNPPTAIPGEYCFAKIFKNDKGSENNNCRIQDASRLLLPDTTAKSCFRLMFNDCATLQYPPTLPNVKTVAYAAYREMFSNCSNLISCGNLVADSICIEAYYGMFQNCTTLVDAPEIMATRIQETEENYAGAMTYMFDGCTALRSMHVHFKKWDVNHTGTSSFTYHWMRGTTTNIADEAKFYCDGLPAAARDESHIQLNWNVVQEPSYVTQDTLSSQLWADNIVYISNGATLTLDNDFNAVKICVAAGCKLTIPESYTLTVDSIILQGGDTTNGTYHYLTPEMVVNGNVKTYNNGVTPILYDYLLNDVQYYTLTLPYDVTISDITYLDGTPAVIGIQDYDGATRVQGKGQGAWRTIYTNDPDVTKIEDATTLSAGIGYTIYTMPQNDDTYSYVRFPMHPNFIAAPEAQKSVSVYGYGCTDGKPTTEGNENNVGWNLIGNPYLATFGNSWVTLRMSDTEVVDYVIIPANDGRSYHPELIINASLPAFKNFFVQVFEDGTLSFDIHTRAQQSPSRAPMTSTRIFAGITLSGNGQEDKMGLTLRDDYTEGYDPYADLSKWMNNGLNLYATVGGNNLTMAAVSADRAQSAIPLVVNTAKAGTLTFTLNHAWDMNIDELEHLYLEDKETGIITDLLSDSYAYEAAKGTTEGRFFLTAIRRNTPTSNEQLQEDTAADVVKFIRDGHLFILRDSRLYDAQGQIIR